jgi:hypothetical protein
MFFGSVAYDQFVREYRQPQAPNRHVSGYKLLLTKQLGFDVRKGGGLRLQFRRFAIRGSNKFRMTKEEMPAESQYARI